MDHKTRVVRYADEEDVKALCKEIAALEKRLSAAERTIKALQNNGITFGAAGITVSNDVAIAGNVVQWDINTQRYVPINVKGNYDQ